MARKAGANSFRLRASVIASSAALAGVVAAGCSGSSNFAPTAYVLAQVQPESSGSSTCTFPDIMTVFTEGMGPNSDPVGIANGTSNAGSVVTVGCAVTQSGSSFSVGASVTTVAAGSFTLNGTMTASGVQQNVSASFGNGTTTFGENDCTFTYTTVTSPPIKVGAVWGVLNCPNMTTGMQDIGCTGTAQVQLTNCTQQ
jgi:hypothetical protein